MKETTRALVDRFVPKETNNRAISDEVHQQIERVIANMPGFLRFGLTVLTIAFNLAGLLHAGKLFSRASKAEQERQILFWQESRLSLLNDYIRFFKQMVPFIYYSLRESGNRDHDVTLRAPNIPRHTAV